jgi:hypothetical protein
MEGAIYNDLFLTQKSCHFSWYVYSTSETRQRRPAFSAANILKVSLHEEGFVCRTIRFQSYDWRINFRANRPLNSFFIRTKATTRAQISMDTCRSTVSTTQTKRLDALTHGNHRNLGTRRRVLKKGVIFSAGLQPILCCKEMFCWVL